ncbi:MAG: cupin [Omnitrophica bacterium RIFCSPLOWO2_12_FULL_44_17]|uniref:Cupin n=1 Tax=Candidatus Danuiimicrobium aquiferis TaxID=1801832 RepID=A0A1G1KQP5_9BACT|nr:MAG: cupin [Omnitrophica bacterium RIFCSPHIGHO2_02_FULL_45_28]OGW89395.1 MAG: cupin [Omnitrophica bacterium RIFCSPHIGHO2_12_FULL_44_12]OGW95243.1 MAG: cupin [Omnitrophica bacterium RIFCSPLOWO2_12_FULL_44_17]OGX02339.1 MAG: cupin [Omnitrophica bacterium RIFCSPLOWO2_02_FULL_44_11]
MKPIDLKNDVKYSKNSIVSKTLVDKKAGTLTLFAFDVGQGLSEHKAPYDAIVQVVDGKGEFFIANKKTEVTAGELMIMPANIPHSVRAKEKFKMLLTMIRS